MPESTPGASAWAERIEWIVETYAETPSDAARRIGITQQSVSALLAGAEPRGRTLEKIARAYPQVSRDWLLTGEGARLRAPDGTPAAVREVLDALAATLDELRARWGV